MATRFRVPIRIAPAWLVEPITMDAPRAEISATTLSQAIARSLTDDIIRGRLPPGQKLDEATLAKRFEVSRTPIRDALRELAVTRLVRYLPHRGFSVIRIGAGELDDMFEAAAEIEALCARLCALRAGATDRVRIGHIHEQGRKFANKRDAVEYARVNEEFHAAIYEGARNKTMKIIALDLRQRLAPFRSRVFYSGDRVQTSCSEHEEIATAILAQDGDRAAESMRRHAAQTALNVIQYFQGLSR
jgi:DNA-binding GntR family transcriptional regulator